MNPSLRQKIVIRVFGRVKVGIVFRPGWRVPLPFYMTRCEEHGYYLDNLHGNSGNSEYMICPTCEELCLGRRIPL